MRSVRPILVASAVVATVGATAVAVAVSSEGALWKMLLVALALGLPGAVAASAHPRNPVGWLLLTIACMLAAMGVAARTTWTGSTGEWASWLVDRGGAVVVPLMFLVLVLLPDGRPPSPRWGPVVVAVTVVQVVLVVAWCLVGSPSGEPNPVGVLPSAWADEVDVAGSWLLQVPFLVAVAAIVSRLRSRDGRVGLVGRWAGRSASPSLPSSATWCCLPTPMPSTCSLHSCSEVASWRPWSAPASAPSPTPGRLVPACRFLSRRCCPHGSRRCWRWSPRASRTGRSPNGS